MLLALLGAATVASATSVAKRLVDVSDTQMEVKEIQKPNVDTFVVTVQRTDDLLADDGTFLAERIMSVAFDFDVQNHEVLLNKVPIPFGEPEQPELPITATVTITAGVIVGPALDRETKAEDLMNAFDEGLVTVQVTASTEFITTEDGTVVRRVTLQETIVEVNGHQIAQTDAAQQVIEIMPDGTLGSYTPLPFGHGCGQISDLDFDEAWKEVDEWFNSMGGAEFLCAMMISMCMFLVSARAVHKAVLRRREAKYAQLHQDEEAAEEYVQVAVVDDKKYTDEKN